MDFVYSNILNATIKELEEKIDESRNISWQNFGRKLKVFYPSSNFPTISITGTECKQNCLYCNSHYLKRMAAITTPKKLIAFAKELEKNSGIGFLISGGYNEESVLPIEPFLDAILKIKETTNLKINIHPGLVNKKQAKEIFNVKIDAVSFDLVTDDQIIDEIIRNGYKGIDYLKSYDYLISAGLNVIPHVCLGLYYGTEKGNLEVINAVLKRETKLIVFLGLIPTKNSPMETSKTIDPKIFLKLLIYTRLKGPMVEQSLGCMRVRLPIFENLAIQTGINRIAVPKSKTLDYASKTYGLEIVKINSCCAI